MTDSRFGGGVSERERQRAKQAKKRRAEQDIDPPDIKDPLRREQLEGDDYAWLKEYMGHVYVNPLPQGRIDNINQMRWCMQYGVRKCIAAPRGSGKTTDFRYILLKDALCGCLPFAVLISASDRKASESENAIRTTLETAMPGSPLFDDYPFECTLAREIARAPAKQRAATVRGMSVFMRWAKNDAMVFPSIMDSEADEEELWQSWRIKPNRLGAIFVACGITSSRLQGANVLNVRPSIIGLDDVDDRESTDIETGRMAEKIETIIDQTIAGMAGQGRIMGQVMLCTVPSRNSVAYKYSDPQQKPAWDGVRIPRIKTWPTAKDKWERYIELKHEGLQKLDKDGKPTDKFGRIAHQYYLDHFAEMNAGAEVYDECDFNSIELPDGSKSQVSALQACYDYIADVGIDSFNTEHQQNPPAKDVVIEAKVTAYHVSTCATDYSQRFVNPATDMIVRAVDVRKIELHDICLVSDDSANNRVVDYGVRTHGTSETTVEQAETLILDGLRELAREWMDSPLTDENGVAHSTELTLIDKGWMGNWTEDGTVKTWATQPVETFCMEMGLSSFLPAKGAPRYSSPEPNKKTIVGDHWHINRGAGKERRCDEVIWDADHWHMLVEELFMLDGESSDRFLLFASGDGIYRNHKAFGEHIQVGAKQLKEQLARGTRSRKPRFVKDHWWDCAAMALVAKSIVAFIREKRKSQLPRMTLSEMAKHGRT